MRSDWEQAYIERARSLARPPAHGNTAANSDGERSEASEESSYDTFERPALTAPPAPSARKPSSLYMSIQHERQARRAAASVHQHMHEVADLLLACSITVTGDHRVSPVATVWPHMRMTLNGIRKQCGHQGACRCKACHARQMQEGSRNLTPATIGRASAADTADWRSPRSSGGSGGGGDGHYFLTPGTLQYGANFNEGDHAVNASATASRASNLQHLLSEDAVHFGQDTGPMSSPMQYRAAPTPAKAGTPSFNGPRTRESVNDYLCARRSTTSPHRGASGSSGAAVTPAHGVYQPPSYRPASAPRAVAEQRGASSHAEEQLARLRGVLRSLQLSEMGGGKAFRRESGGGSGKSARLLDADCVRGGGRTWLSPDRLLAPKPAPPPTPGAWQGPDGGRDSACSRRARSAQLVRKLKPFLEADGRWRQRSPRAVPSGGRHGGPRGSDYRY